MPFGEGTVVGVYFPFAAKSIPLEVLGLDGGAAIGLSAGNGAIQAAVNAVGNSRYCFGAAHGVFAADVGLDLAGHYQDILFGGCFSLRGLFGWFCFSHQTILPERKPETLLWINDDLISLTYEVL